MPFSYCNGLVWNLSKYSKFDIINYYPSSPLLSWAVIHVPISEVQLIAIRAVFCAQWPQEYDSPFRAFGRIHSNKTWILSNFRKNKWLNSNFSFGYGYYVPRPICGCKILAPFNKDCPETFDTGFNFNFVPDNQYKYGHVAYLHKAETI